MYLHWVLGRSTGGVELSNILAFLHPDLWFLEAAATLANLMWVPDLDYERLAAG